MGIVQCKKQGRISHEKRCNTSNMGQDSGIMQMWYYTNILLKTPYVCLIDNFFLYI